MLPKFNDKKGANKNVRLLMSDTDSLVYHIKKPISAVYAKLKHNPWMDFSNYKDRGHFSDFYSAEKYLTPGFMKDESNGSYIEEFAGCAAKAYSLKLEEDVEKMRLKGVKSAFTANHIRHEHFCNAVLDKDYTIEFAFFYDIKSKHHQLKTVRCTKSTLVPFNNKKYFADGDGTVYSFGHKDIPAAA